MRSLSISRKFFAQFDMFAAPPTLRARKQSQTSSYTSGVLSFMLAILFTYVFCIKFYMVLTYENIDSNQTSTKLTVNETKADRIYFAVGVGYQTIQNIYKNFIVGSNITLSSKDNITIQLQPCKVEAWSDMQNYQQKFDHYKLSEFLCPKQKYREVLNISRQYYAPESSFITIWVRPCIGEPQCNPLSQQQNFVQQIKDRQDAIFMVVYFLDSILSPQEEFAVSHDLNTDSQFAFTLKRGIICTIQLASYRIITDKGIFPFQQLKQQKGYMVNSFRETSIQLQDLSQDYSLIYITMNRKHIRIQRTVGKIDQMLSYAGGLFSIITGFLSFFMISYNKNRYELMVAEGVFNNDENGNVIRENDFSFWKYIKYTIFDWVDLLFCRELSWEDCKIVHQARQQANSHLDVTLLFRKINHMERALRHLLNQNQKDCLCLVRPQSLNQIRRQRLALQYYQQIIRGETATTIDEYKTAQSLLKFSWNLYQKSMKTNRVLNLDVLQTPAQFQFGSEIDRRKTETVDQILQRFPELTRAALDIKLDNQMQQIQNQLCNSFYNLNQEQRQKFQQTIPIKILIRLKKKRQQKQEEQSQSKKSSQFNYNFASVMPRNVKIDSINYGESSQNSEGNIRASQWKYIK